MPEPLCHRRYDVEGYTVLETAAGSGDRLLDFFSESEPLARALFDAELRGAGAAAIP